MPKKPKEEKASKKKEDKSQSPSKTQGKKQKSQPEKAQTASKDAGTSDMQKPGTVQVKTDYTFQKDTGTDGTQKSQTVQAKALPVSEKDRKISTVESSQPAQTKRKESTRTSVIKKSQPEEVQTVSAPHRDSKVAPEVSSKRKNLATISEKSDHNLTHLVQKLYVTRRSLKPMVDDIIERAYCVASNCCKEKCFCPSHKDGKGQTSCEGMSKLPADIKVDGICDCNKRFCPCRNTKNYSKPTVFVPSGSEVQKSLEVLKQYETLKDSNSKSNKAGEKYSNINTSNNLVDQLETLRNLTGIIIQALEGEIPDPIIIRKTLKTSNIPQRPCEDSKTNQPTPENLLKLKKEYKNLYDNIDLLKHYLKESTSTSAQIDSGMKRGESSWKAKSSSNIPDINVAGAKELILDCFNVMLEFKQILEQYAQDRGIKTKSDHQSCRSKSARRSLTRNSSNVRTRSLSQDSAKSPDARTSLIKQVGKATKDVSSYGANLGEVQDRANLSQEPNISFHSSLMKRLSQSEDSEKYKEMRMTDSSKDDQPSLQSPQHLTATDVKSSQNIESRDSKQLRAIEEGYRTSIQSRRPSRASSSVSNSQSDVHSADTEASLGGTAHYIEPSEMSNLQDQRNGTQDKKIFNDMSLPSFSSVSDYEFLNSFTQQSLTLSEEMANPYVPSESSLPIINKQVPPQETKDPLPFVESRSSVMVGWLSSSGIPFKPSVTSMPRSAKEPSEVLIGYVALKPSTGIPYEPSDSSLPQPTKSATAVCFDDHKPDNSTKLTVVFEKTNSGVHYNPNIALPRKMKLEPPNEPKMPPAENEGNFFKTANGTIYQPRSSDAKDCSLISKNQNRLEKKYSSGVPYVPSASSIPTQNINFCKVYHENFVYSQGCVSLVHKDSIGIRYEPSTGSIRPEIVKNASKNYSFKNSKTHDSGALVKEHVVGSNHTDNGSKSQQKNLNNCLGSENYIPGCNKIIKHKSKESNAGYTSPFSSTIKGDKTANNIVNSMSTEKPPFGKPPTCEVRRVRTWKFRSKSLEKIRRNVNVIEHRRNRRDVNDYTSQRRLKYISTSATRSCPEIIMYHTKCYSKDLVLAKDTNTGLVNDQLKGTSKLTVLKGILENHSTFDMMSPLHNTPIVMTITNMNSQNNNNNRINDITRMPKNLKELVNLIQIVQQDENQQTCPVCQVVNPTFSPTDSREYMQGIFSSQAIQAGERERTCSQVEAPDVSRAMSRVTWRPDSELESLKDSSISVQEQFSVSESDKYKTYAARPQPASRTTSMITGATMSQMSGISERPESSTSRIMDEDFGEVYPFPSAVSTRQESQISRTPSRTPQAPSGVYAAPSRVHQIPSTQVMENDYINYVDESKVASTISTRPESHVSGLVEWPTSRISQGSSRISQAPSTFSEDPSRSSSLISQNSSTMLHAPSRIAKAISIIADAPSRISRLPSSEDFGEDSRSQVPSMQESKTSRFTEKPPSRISQAPSRITMEEEFVAYDTVARPESRIFSRPESQISSITTGPASRMSQVPSRVFQEGGIAESRISQEPSRAGMAESRIFREPSRAGMAESRISQEPSRAGMAESRISQDPSRTGMVKSRILQEPSRADMTGSRISQEQSRTGMAESRILQEPSRAGMAESRIFQEPSRAAMSQSRISQDPSRAGMAESRISQVTSRAGMAESRISQEPSRVGMAESRISQDPSRAGMAESRISQEPSRAGMAESRISQEPSRAGIAQSRMSQEPSRAGIAESRISQEPSRAGVAESRISQKSSRAGMAESRISQEPSRAGMAESIISQEPSRVGIAESRISQEPSRVGMAESRISQEPSRAGMAESRISQEPSRAGIAESRISQKSSRAGMAESRISQEPSRAGMAESRISQEPSRVGMAESRISQEPSRVGMAESRISQEPSRAGMAESRISQEPSRAGVAESRISQKSSRAGMAESRISQDPSRAGMAASRFSQEPSRAGMAESRIFQEPSRAGMAESRISQVPSRAGTVGSRVSQSPSRISGVPSRPALEDEYTISTSWMPTIVSGRSESQISRTSRMLDGLVAEDEFTSAKKNELHAGILQVSKRSLAPLTLEQDACYCGVQRSTSQSRQNIEKGRPISAPSGMSYINSGTSQSTVNRSQSSKSSGMVSSQMSYTIGNPSNAAVNRSVNSSLGPRSMFQESQVSQGAAYFMSANNNKYPTNLHRSMSQELSRMVKEPIFEGNESYDSFSQENQSEIYDYNFEEEQSYGRNNQMGYYNEGNFLGEAKILIHNNIPPRNQIYEVSSYRGQHYDEVFQREEDHLENPYRNRNYGASPSRQNCIASSSRDQSVQTHSRRGQDFCETVQTDIMINDKLTRAAGDISPKQFQSDFASDSFDKRSPTSEKQNIQPFITNQTKKSSREFILYQMDPRASGNTFQQSAESTRMPQLPFQIQNQTIYAMEISEEEYGNNFVSRPVDAVLPICHCRDSEEMGVFVPVPCESVIQERRGFCYPEICPCDCLNIPQQTEKQISQVVLKESLSEEIVPEKSISQYMPDVDTLRYLDEQPKPCTCPIPDEPLPSDRIKSIMSATKTSPEKEEEEEYEAELQSVLSAKSRTYEEIVPGPQPSEKLDHLMEAPDDMRPCDRSGFSVTVMRGGECCPCKAGLPSPQRTTFLKNAAAHGDRVMPIDQPCAATSQEVFTRSNYMQDVVGSGLVGEGPSETSNLDKVLWALARVSIFDDGTRTFEILEASPIPPGHYLLPEPDDE